MVHPRGRPFDSSRIDNVTGLRKVFMRTGSPHPPELQSDMEREDYEDRYKVGEKREARRAQISALARDIRAKSQWYFKVLQHEGLVEKWVAESQLDDGKDIQDLVTELKQEARRIYVLDHSVRLESASLPERIIEWDTISVDVNRTNSYLRNATHAIDEPELYEKVGAYVVDDVVPKALHDELVRELNALAAMDPKDFHPGSGGKVQDLIHPSLYPYMADVTPVLDSVTPPPTEDGKFVTSMAEKHEYEDGSVTFESAYAWIPAVIQVSPQGNHVAIDSYINGLGSRDQFPTLFRIIEQVFELTLPLLEKTMSYDMPHGTKNAYQRWEERRDFLEGAGEPFQQDAWNDLLKRQADEKAADHAARNLEKAERARLKQKEAITYTEEMRDASAEAVSCWAGRSLKVVIKAANYILQPGQVYSGTWHIEGMPHERVVASAIYYYDRDASIQDPGLYLRRRREEGDFPFHEEYRYDDFDVSFTDPSQPDGYYRMVNNPSDYGSDQGLGIMDTYINVGVIPTIRDEDTPGTGRIVTFPNWLQHRVVSLRNDPAAPGPALRKILCFFLVDDGENEQCLRSDPQYDPTDLPGIIYSGIEEMKVLTSKDIPSQARACNLPTVAFLVRVAFRQIVGRFVPNELISLMLLELEGPGAQMTREEAEERRRALMDDRRVSVKGVNEFWELSWSLCEH